MAGCEEGANTGPDASHSAEGGGGAAAEEVLSVLLCMQCRAPICRYEDIFSNRATDVWAAQVYAYELDLFDDKPPLWCCSATNPSARRFDLVRNGMGEYAAWCDSAWQGHSTPVWCRCSSSDSAEAGSGRQRQ
ncbi:hypothetical protein DQ04_04911030 [Trypanosoma grayi]|uniref:hypothetical protein n=1 Tax=Trypanosoma grayi TaxID=71804 RepID=UPI0004F40DC4|nr:hypothetical protein DQ04_04911030 [Trypanosoma grayi]KEG09634.1 hypothetical protein DQ04_04911030 [Trypanosoma grayi]